MQEFFYTPFQIYNKSITTIVFEKIRIENKSQKLFFFVVFILTMFLWWFVELDLSVFLFLSSVSDIPKIDCFY